MATFDRPERLPDAEPFPTLTLTFCVLPPLLLLLELELEVCVEPGLVAVFAGVATVDKKLDLLILAMGRT